MKKQVLFIFWLVNSFYSFQLFSETKTIHVEKAGTFAEYLPEQDRYSVTKLILSGELNGTDIQIIRDMAGCVYSETPYNLKDIDMSNVKIVAGGYAYGDSFKKQNTSNNIIGEYMFFGAQILESIRLPNTTELIDGLSFSSCPNLKEVVIPELVSSIGASAFARCPKLSSIILPDKITTIEGFTFEESGLTSVKIPQNVTIMRWGVFRNCDNLSSIDLPESLEHIDYDVFENCVKLVEIIIPEKVQFIGDKAFYNCYNLKNMYANAKKPPLSISKAFYGITDVCTLNIPYGTYSLYSTADNWKDFKNIVEEENPSSNEIIFSEKLIVYGENNQLFIESDIPATAFIYSVSGSLIKQINIKTGINQVPITSGICIVSVNGKSYKVLVK